MKMKSLVSIALAALIILSVTAFAELTAYEPPIENVTYEGAGIVEIELIRDVKYTQPSITVVKVVEDDELPDVEIEAEFIKLDDDDLEFRLINAEPDTVYEFTVTGVTERRSGDEITLNAQFTTPAEGDIAIAHVDYDRDDKEMEVEFVGKVSYDSPTVTVITADGERIEARVTEMDRDSIDVRLSKKLRLGDEYTVVVTGVIGEFSEEAFTAEATFIAYDD